MCPGSDYSHGASPQTHSSTAAERAPTQGRGGREGKGGRE